VSPNGPERQARDRLNAVANARRRQRTRYPSIFALVAELLAPAPDDLHRILTAPERVETVIRILAEMGVDVVEVLRHQREVLSIGGQR
jgi:hypothetical protein